MAREFNRSDRVADAVQRSLATIIPREVRDPRVGMVNINVVEVTRDLSLAKVYVTFVGQSEKQKCRESVEVLNRAANFLRNAVGSEMSMRSVPRIQFFYDESAVRGHELSQLIDKAVAGDRAHKSEGED